MKNELRPTKLEDYIGQEQIKDLLSTAIASAKQRNQALEHVLLNGPPGLGKTTLAQIIANELGWRIKTTISPNLGNGLAIQNLFTSTKPKTIFFIDEVHRLRKPVQEILYPVLEDGRLYSVFNSQVELPLNPLTIIGATTNIGRLEQPFIDRFTLQFQLEYYTNDELCIIIYGSASKLKMQIEEGAIEAIAQRARGTPRIANNLLKRVRDYAVVRRVSVSPELVEEILGTKLHIDELGLRKIDRRYLHILASSGSMGIEAIATKLNEEVDTVEGYIEPFLIKVGLVERGRSGRWITDKGRKYAENRS